MRTTLGQPPRRPGRRTLVVLAGLILAGGLILWAAARTDRPGAASTAGAVAAQAAGGTSTATTTGFPAPDLSPTGTPTSSATSGVAPTATSTALPPLPGSPTPAWWRVTSPDVGGLSGVAGVQPDDLWAVGGTSLHWDGSMWQMVPLPTPTWGAGSAPLWKASAGTGESVWGVGNVVFTGGEGPPRVEYWDGHQWTVIYPFYTRHAPDISPATEMHDVSAYSPTDAYAVSVDANIVNADLNLLHCTATLCTRVAGYGGPNEIRLGYGVTAFAANDAWIVGEQANMDPAATPVPGTLILHWNGQQLTAPAHPDIGRLDGVGGAAPDNVWAVGPAGFLHWDGQSWQQVPSPGGASRVSARAWDDAWALGGAGFLHWDGQTWRQVPGAQGALADVLALAADDAWAAGVDAQNRSLVEHYTSLPAFSDVPVAAPFYPYVAWMVDHGYVSGYGCGGPGEPCGLYPRPYYRPGASVTRAQLLKMVVAAAAWPLPTPPAPTFADVPATSPFYAVIETGVAQGIISGYTCGGPGEPCDAQQRLYFRPYAPITRGQLAKVISLARGYTLPVPGMPTFADVSLTQPFYRYIEAVAAQGVVSGYSCGGPGEPCPGVYFRAGSSATRGQVAKFVALAYYGARLPDSLH